MNNINILGIDTALNFCSVALLHNNDIKEIANLSHQDRSRNLLTILNELLQDMDINELSALVFSAGPGSLTGLKISSSVIQALSLAYNKPIIKVSTLQALALQAYEQFGEALIMPCIDAKMGEVYYGVYRIFNQGSLAIPIPIQQDVICSISKLKIVDPNLLLVSDDTNFLSSIFPMNFQNKLNIKSVLSKSTAKYIVKIANYIYINYDDKVNYDAIPLYLRLYE